MLNRPHKVYSMKDVNVVCSKGLKLGFNTYRDNIRLRGHWFKTNVSRRKKRKLK